MKLPIKAITYIVFVILSSIFVILFSFHTWSIPTIDVILFWSALAIISESLNIVIFNNIEISIGFAIDLACIIVGNPSLAIVVSITTCLFKVVKEDGKYFHIFNIPFYKTFFNIALYTLSSGLAGFAYVYSGGGSSKLSFLPILFAILTAEIVNSIVLGILLSILANNSFINVWLSNFKELFINYVAIGALGVIIAIASMNYGSIAVFIFFGPLLIARYSFKLYLNMRHTYIDTIQAFNKVLEAKDTYTSGHAARVQKYAELLGYSIPLSDSRIENLKTAALLHDIGKIGVDDSILRKPGKLTSEEYNKIKNHVVIGAEIIDGIDFLKSISKIIIEHHERFDGKGYPQGLKGGQLSTEGEILAIADVYDAMTSDRPYRKGMTKEEAKEELRANSGTQFNPVMVDHFLKILDAEDTPSEELNLM